MPGFDPCTDAKSSPNRAIPPGLKFSIITSARPASSRARARSDSSRRSRTTERLPRLTPRKYVEIPSRSGGLHDLVSSPVGGPSTLTTSAPMSASSIVA